MTAIDTTDDTTAIDTAAIDTAAIDTTPTKPKRSKAKKTTPTTEKPTPTPAKAKPIASVANARFGLTLVMSALPGLSLVLSSTAGALLLAGTHTAYALATIFFALTACVLAISLPHLAWAIEDITRSDSRSATILAVAFDASIVALELLATAGHGTVTTEVTMFFLAALSAVLNAWAFLRKPTSEEKAARKAAKAGEAGR